MGSRTYACYYWRLKPEVFNRDKESKLLYKRLEKALEKYNKDFNNLAVAVYNIGSATSDYELYAQDLDISTEGAEQIFKEYHGLVDYIRKAYKIAIRLHIISGNDEVNPDDSDLEEGSDFWVIDTETQTWTPEIRALCGSKPKNFVDYVPFTTFG